MTGFHHVRARMRRTKGLKPFPSANVWEKFFDYLMYGVGILAPIALVPQILQIYETKNSAGISLTTWIFLGIINALWALYGVAHKDKQLIFANALITLFDLVIVVGILVY